MSDKHDDKANGHENGNAPDNVTLRFEERATLRFDPDAASRATQRFEPAAMPGPGTPRMGELVQDRYRIEEGPIGEATGEGEVFRCTDTQSGASVALKMYRSHVVPKQDVISNLLNIRHPNIIRLQTSGTWAGRFYEVMDYCEGGSLMDHMPFDEPALRQYLSQVLNGLQYLHTQGIVHRDIKPNNLFFRHVNCEDVVIGDFGVSSVLDTDQKVRHTSTGAFFTLDYAAPELIDGKQVSPKTDYYGLGITLIHLATGMSPFNGMDKNTVLGCHFRGTVPRPASVSREFQQLIGGLLRVSPESRWGYDQVWSWLHGEVVLTDDGLPDHDDVYVGKQVPYRSLPEIKTPYDMARRLHEFDVERDLQRGFVSQWVMFFDTQLGQRVADLEEEYANDMSLGVFKLKYLLDPSQALEVGDRRVYNMRQLIDLLASQARDMHERELQSLLYSGSIEVWVDAMDVSGAAADLVNRLQSLRQRVKCKEVGVTALLFTLDPKRPFHLARYASITDFDQLENLLKANPELAARLTHYLYAGHFAEWLRAAFPSRKADVKYLEQCVKTFTSDQELGVMAMRWRFAPTMPFRMGARSADNPKELAAMIGNSPASFTQGTRMLCRGWIRTWLVSTGQLRNTEAFDEVVNDVTITSERKMEAVLHLLDPALAWPSPAADIEEYDAGSISTESSKSVSVTIFNAGRGWLSGTVALDDESFGQGFSMTPCTIEGTTVTVHVTMHGQGLQPRSHQETRILVDTNGGLLEIPISFKVGAPASGMLLRSVLAGILMGQVFGLVRLAVQHYLPNYRWEIMHWIPWTQTDADELFALTPLAVLFIFGLGGLFYYAQAKFRLDSSDEAAPPPIVRQREDL